MQGAGTRGLTAVEKAFDLVGAGRGANGIVGQNQGESFGWRCLRAERGIRGSATMIGTIQRGPTARRLGNRA